MNNAIRSGWAAVISAALLAGCGGNTDNPAGAGHLLSINVSGAGTVNSVPAGVSCSTSCTVEFVVQTSVTLTATPAQGQVFAGWSGACSGAAPTCSVTLSADRSVRASFEAASQTGWVAILSDAAGGASTPRVVVDAAGRALAVWQQITPSGQDVWASRYLPASGWSAPTLLDNSNGGVRELQITMHRTSGRAMVAWQQITSASGYDLWARPFDPGTGWGTAATVENAPGALGYSSIGMDADGNAMAVWSQLDGRFSVWANRFLRQGGWGTASLIETNDAVGATDGDPQVAVAPNGDAVAVWKQSTGSAAHLWSNRFSAASGWASASPVVQDAGSTQFIGGFDLALDAAGNGLLVWGQLDVVAGGNESSVWARRFASGAWQIERFALAPPVAASTGLISQPALTLNAAGSALVVWGREDGSLVANAAPPNAAFGNASVFRAAGSHTLGGLPEVGLDDQGTALVVWAESGTGTTPGLWLARGGLGLAWDAPAVFVDTDGADSTPALAVNERGDALMAWSRLFASGGSRIMARQLATGR